jgi:hypothetical protein
MNSVKQIAQAYTQTPWRKQVQIGGLILSGILFAVSISSIYLNVNARASTYGREILLMQAELENQQLINADLRSQLGLIDSPAILEKRAIEMGFEPITRDEQTYVLVPGYVAKDEVEIAPPPQPIDKVMLTLPPDFTQSLIDWLKQRFIFLSNPTLESQP